MHILLRNIGGNLLFRLRAVACDDLRLGHSFLDTHARPSNLSTVAGQRLLFIFQSPPEWDSSLTYCPWPRDKTKTHLCLLTWLSVVFLYPVILFLPASCWILTGLSWSRMPWIPSAAWQEVSGSASTLSPPSRRSSLPARLPVSWRSPVALTEPASSSPPPLWSGGCRHGVVARRWCGGARCLHRPCPGGLSALLYKAPGVRAHRHRRTRWPCPPPCPLAPPPRKEAPPWCGDVCCRPSYLHGIPLSTCPLLSASLLTGPSWGVASAAALHCGDAQSGGLWWEGTKSCRGNPVETWGDWGGRMESTVERGAEEVGYMPAVKEEYCSWTCSDRLWCSGLRHVGNWDGPVARGS